MVFKLEALPAGKGDCLLLHYGDGGRPRTVLIDGGPADTYAPRLRPRLEELRAERGLGDEEPLEIEAVVVSHIDDDHINGILELARELSDLKARHEAPFVTVATLWHNAFDDIVGNDEIGSAAASVLASTGGAGVPGVEGDAAMILASLAQGRDLRDEAAVLGWSINSGLGAILSTAKGPSEPIVLPDGLEVSVVGPRKAEIARLQKKHDDFLRRKGLARSDPAAALQAFEDRSVPNLSSLVLLVRQGERTMLLTGDARGDKLLLGLEEQKLIEPGRTLDVDVFKVMHHGSHRNATEDVFRRVRAAHYVFCGDGEHGNPERRCLEMLFAARPSGGYTLYFTYEIADIDARRREEAREWVAERDGLAQLLRDKRAEGVGFEVVTPGGAGRVSIDL